MKRILMLAAVLALAASPAMIANAASSAPPGPYKLDSKGKCHAANGQFVATSLCPKSTAPHCTTGVPCGNTCIAKGKVCHH